MAHYLKRKRFMITLKILTGSVRPGRFNDQPANWIYNLAKERTDLQVELLNLAKINLPLLDEPVPASMHQYNQEHTKKWSALVDSADAFIFVTPEYNHSTSAALKNAIDYLFSEWHYKPVSFLSYGSLAGGSRAVEHLRQIAAEIRMYDLREQILLPNYWENVDAQGKYQFNERHVKSANEIIDQLIFWGTIMKEARAKLT